MFASPLVSGRLERRYKRFLADILLDDGSRITASVPNTGSMLGLTTAGAPVWLSVSDAPHRKYRHTWQLVHADNTMVGVNTGLPNKIAEEAIGAGLIPSLKDYPDIRREQKYGRNSRIDLLLDGHPDLPRAYVEVKNVHFMRQRGLAEFPDTTTQRGAKHLEELANMVRAGERGVMIYVVQRGDCDRFSICGDLDPHYAAAYAEARAAGVEAIALSCTVTETSITATRVISIV